MATGQERIARLRELGASDDEITAWMESTSGKLREKGATDAEIASYWGRGALNMAAVDEYVKRQTEQPDADGVVQPEETARRAKGLIDAFRAGEQQSVTGLARRGRLPDIAVSEDQNIGLHIASALGTLAGDIPVVVPAFIAGAKPGAVIGGVAGGGASRNPAGAAAGAAAGGLMSGTAISSFVTEDIRQTLIKTYRDNKGQDLTPVEFSASLMANALSKEVLSTAFRVTAAETAGAAVAGPVLGRAVSKGAGPISREITVGGTQMTGAIAAGSALEGELPTAQEFGTAAAIALTGGFIAGGVEAGAARRAKAPKPGKLGPENTAEILEDVYVKTGKKPGDVAREADGDPLVRDAIITGADLDRPGRLYIEHMPETPEPSAAKAPSEEVVARAAIDPEVRGEELKNTYSVPGVKDGEGVRWKDTRGQNAQYHGARGAIEGLYEGGGYSPLNYYGPGFYTTDAVDIASGYTRKRAAGKIYKVEEVAPVTALDAEAPIPDWLIEGLDDDIILGAFEDGSPSNVRELFDEIRDFGTNEGLTADDIQELFDTLQYRMLQRGFNAMDHKGGLRTNKKEHKVRIYFEPEVSVKVSEVPTEEMMRTASSINEEIKSIREAREEVAKYEQQTSSAGAFNEGDRLNMPEKAIDVEFVDEGDTTWSKYARGGRGVRPPDPPPPPPDSPASFSKGDDPAGSSATQKDVEDVLGSMAASKKKQWMDIDDFRYLTVDDLQYAKSFIRTAHKEATGKPLAFEDNPGELMALARGAHARAEQHIMRGVFDPATGDKMVRGLNEIYTDLGSRDRKRAFRAYMISKRLMEKQAQGFDVPVSEAHAKIAASGDKSGEVTALWQEIQDWNNVGLEELRGTVLNDQALATIRSQNENFVPLWSADMDFPKGRDTPRGVPVRDPLKKFKGGDFDFVDPFDAMVRNRFFVMQTAMNAQARLRYADFNDNLPAAARVMDRITPRRVKKGETPEKDSADWLWAREIYDNELTHQPGDPMLPALPDLTKAEKQAYQEKLKNIDPERALVVQGDDGKFQVVTIDDLVGGSRELTEMKDAHGMLAEDFTWLHVKPELDRRFGKRNIVVYRDGRPEVYRPRDPRLAYAFEHLSMGEHNQLIKVLSIPAQVARAGITSMPTFWIPAMMRDTIDATLINHFKSTPVVTITDGAVGTLLKDKDFARFVENGGSGGALINMDANILKQSLTDFEDNKLAHVHRKAYNAAHSAYRVLYSIASATDQFNRVGAVKGGAREGITPQQQALRGRVMSLDHARAGAAMRAINKIVMFLGPTINGVDRAVMAARNDPLRLTMLATAYLTIPSLILWAANADEEWYKELTPQQKGLNWHVRVGGTAQDPVIVPISKPHTWVTLFATTPELAMDHIHKTENPDLAKNILEGFAKDFLIDPTEITASSWATEIASNHDGFLDRPLVPQRLERAALPEYRYTPYTTETAKNVAKLIPDQIPPRFRTPIAVDHMINSLTGTRGTGLLREFERILGAAGVIERTPTSRDVWQESTFVRRFLIAEPRYTKTIDDFYNSADLARQAFGTYKEMIIQGRAGEADKIRKEYGDLMVKADGLERASGQVFAMVRMIEFNKEMKPYEKQQNIDNLMRPLAQAMAIYNEEMRQRKLGREEE